MSTARTSFHLELDGPAPTAILTLYVVSVIDLFRLEECPHKTKEPNQDKQRNKRKQEMFDSIAVVQLHVVQSSELLNDFVVLHQRKPFVLARDGDRVDKGFDHFFDLVAFDLQIRLHDQTMSEDGETCGFDVFGDHVVTTTDHSERLRTQQHRD